MPKVSILLPTKNGEQYIREAIESVLRQTYTNWELYVIDNGSTDETTKIVSEYAQKDSRIVPLRYIEKEGIQYALNYGLHRSKAEYIARIDDDDKWNSPEKLEQQALLLEGDKSLVLVGTSLRTIDERGAVIGGFDYPTTDEDIRRSFSFSNPFAHASVVFRREAALAVGGYSEKYRYVQDYDLWMKMAKHGRVANLGDRYLDWRIPRKGRPEYDYLKSRYQLSILFAHRFEYPLFVLGFLKITLRTAVLFAFKRADRARRWIKYFFARLRTFDLISLIFVISTATLVWRHGSIANGIPKPFEVGIVATLILVLLTLLSSTYTHATAIRFWKVVKVPVVLLGLFTAATVLAAFLSQTFIADASMQRGEISLDFVRLGFVFMLFLLAVYLALRKRGIVKATLATLAVSPVIFWLFLIPPLQSFFLEAGRLRGAENDPNYLATLLSVAFFTSFIGYVRMSSRVRYLALALTATLTPLLLLSGSRAAWFSASITYLVYVVYELVRARGRLLGRLTLATGVIVVSLGLGFLTFPKHAQVNITYRAFTGILSPRAFSSLLSSLGANSANNLNSPGGVEVLESELAPVKPIGFGQHRGLIWRVAVRRFLGHPLGYGPAFYTFAPLEVVNGLPQSSHNLYLEAGLTAGYIGFIAWLMFIYYIAKVALRGMRRSYIGTILAVSFFYLLINSFFLNTLTLRWLWVVMAFILAYEARVRDNKA